MKKKDIFKINCLLGSIASMTILPITIIGCSKNNNSQTTPDTVDLNEEIARINNLNLTLKNDLITEEEINGFISGPLTFLDQKVNNWVANSNFSYIATLSNDQSKKQLKLTIEVVDKSNPENKGNSKEFIFSYRVKQNLDKEVQRINDSQIRLNKEKFTQIEIDQINGNANKIKDYLTNVEFKNSIFSYDVINFQNQNSEFKFKFKIRDIQDLSDSRETKEFVFKYEIQPTEVTPGDSGIIRQEINRIDSNFNPTLIKQDITYQELLDINKKNLLDKLTNASVLDKNKFDYSIYYISKFLDSKSRKISFRIEINIRGQAKPPDDLLGQNFSKEISLNFNLIETEKPKYEIKDEYLKGNVVDPITNGSQYYFSTPGSGTGKNSINISSGQGKTQPSAGVPESGKIIKGYVYNETEVRQLKNTFSLAFVDYSGATALGTGWILDYKLTDDDSYPTTWYIATNAHVIQNLKIPNDTISPERFEISNDEREFNNTNYLQMRTVRNPQIGKYIPTLEYWENEVFVSADIPAINLKTIYIGLDFLKTSPSDFTTGAKWQDSEEYADFAVMEVKFADADEAKKMTHDYVNDTNRHFKYKKKSLLKDEVKKEYYSVLGFPDAGRQTPYEKKVDLYTSRGANANNEPTNPNKELLTNLATSPYYNTFNGKQGMFDAALGFAFFGMDYRLAFQLKEWYNSWGLIYPVDYGSLGPGSSGSMLMDKDGYTVGIHFAGDPTATMGFSQALYCEGFNYQGKFGSYNLEGYDLIEGGFANQKSSYKDNLKKLYGSNFKTKLFSNGLN